jgi:hypothetical protein
MSNPCVNTLSSVALPFLRRFERSCRYCANLYSICVALLDISHQIIHTPAKRIYKPSVYVPVLWTSFTEGVFVKDLIIRIESQIWW